MKHFSNYSLKNHNTLKIDVKCDDYFYIESNEDLENDEIYQKLKGTRLVLGKGANILFTKDFSGSVLQLTTDKISVVSESDKEVIIDANGGVVWHDLVTYAVSHNWGGIENMALIPGLVGAAPIGNIAAYGQNFSDACVGVTAYEFETGKIRNFTHTECDFSYRESIFKHALKGKYLIMSVRFHLQKNPEINSDYWSKKHGSVGEMLTKNSPPPYTIKNIFEAVIALRQEKFPDIGKFGTAGSFYKNPVITKKKFEEIIRLVPHVQYYPAEGLHYIDNKKEFSDDMVKVAAGDILDNGMGYKGLWVGNVGLFEQHALVLVTNGNATPDEVVTFAEKIEKDFYEYCGIRLEREVITI